MIEYLLGVTLIFLYMLWHFSPDAHTLELGNKIPGPPRKPIIGNLFYMPSKSKDAFKKRVKMIEEFGHTQRVWFGKDLIVIISDPKDFEPIMKSTIHIDKSWMYNYLNQWLGTGLLTSSGEKWFKRRKAITPAFHFKIVENFIDTFNKNGSILVDCLRATSGKLIEIRPFISRYGLDVICETAMGTKVNAQLDASSPYVTAIKNVCFLIQHRIITPWLRSDLVFKLAGFQAKMDENIKILHGETLKVIKEKEEKMEKNGKPLNEDEFGIKNKTFFLESLLEMKGNGTFDTDEDIREEVDTFMFEGHDTVTSSICFTLYCLAKNPEIQNLVYSELISLLGEEKREPTYNDLQNMKYLERVIKESLRLYPSVPFVARQIVEDIAIPSGYILPKGCIVGLSMFFSHRHPDHFRNPEKFDPDHFLPEVVVKRHPFAYVPFSAGPRNCIGQKFAMNELKSSISKLVLNFNIECENEEVEVEGNLVLHDANRHKIKLSCR